MLRICPAAYQLLFLAFSADAHIANVPDDVPPARPRGDDKLPAVLAVLPLPSFRISPGHAPPPLLAKEGAHREHLPAPDADLRAIERNQHRSRARRQREQVGMTRLMSV